MQPIKNLWLNTNRHEITAVQKQLVALSYSGGNIEGINVMQINNIIGNCMKEIIRLQDENDVLRKTLETKDKQTT